MASHLVIAWVSGNFTDGCTNCSVPCIPGTLCVSAAPPFPLTVNSTGDDSTPIHLHNRSRLVPNLLIATAALLAASFLLLLATYAVHRYRRRRRPPSPADPPPPPGDDDDLFEEGGGDHHVWHIRTVGLDDATIRSIDACVYTAQSGLLDGAADCSVCLAEFRDGELLRLLPKCGHAFHLPCIDTWLRSHVNCPLCRAPIIAQAATAAAAADPENSAPPAAAAIDPVGSDSGPSSLPENTQVDIEQFETAQVVPEEGKEGRAVEIGIRINPTAASSSMLSSSESPGNFGEDGLQPVRRSVSMDSVSLGALLLMVDPEEKSTEERTEADAVEDQAVKNRGRGANAAKGAPLQKASIKIERSLSSRSGRFFLSRYGRARNSILPL